MNQADLEFSRQRNRELHAQADALAIEAQKELVRLYIERAPSAWDQGTTETDVTPLLVESLLKIENATHIGYIYRLALTGEPFAEFRSVKASRPGRLHVYGRTASGEIQYAGSMDRKTQLYYALKRQARAEREALRHRSAPSWDGRRR